MYKNYRCRKCGKYISMEKRTEEDNRLVFVPQRAELGIMITKEYAHSDCNISEDEYVYADLVSISENPIPESSFVYNWNSETKKYELCSNKENL